MTFYQRLQFSSQITYLNNVKYCFFLEIAPYQAQPLLTSCIDGSQSSSVSSFLAVKVNSGS